LFLTLPSGTAFYLPESRFFVLIPSRDHSESEELLCELDFHTNTVLSTFPIPRKHRLIDILGHDSLLLDHQISDTQHDLWKLDLSTNRRHDLGTVYLDYSAHISHIHLCNDQVFVVIRSSSSSTLYALTGGRLLHGLKTFNSDALFSFSSHLCVVLSRASLYLFDFNSHRMHPPLKFPISLFDHPVPPSIFFSHTIHPFAIHLSDQITLMPVFI
jgi:hypothetical protein